IALAGRLRVRRIDRDRGNRGKPWTEPASPEHAIPPSSESSCYLSPPRVRRALIQMTTMTMATTRNSKAIRIRSFLQRYFEAFGQGREIFRRVEIDRGIRHRHAHQPIAVALQDRARAVVAAQLGELRETQARKNRRHPQVLIVDARGNQALLAFPGRGQPFEIVRIHADLIAEQHQHSVAGRRQRSDAEAQRRAHALFPKAIHDHRCWRVRQQVRHLARVRAYHDGHRVAGQRNGIRHHNVQRRPAAQLHELLRLPEACGCAGGQDEDVERHRSDTIAIAIRTVLNMGDSLLLQVAQPVQRFGSVELAALLEDMHDTMEEQNGAGLAAPQIGVSLQVVIFGVARNPRYPQAEEVPYTVLINPQLEAVSEEMEEGWEGCLSVPGMRGLVPRYTQLRYRG